MLRVARLALIPCILCTYATVSTAGAPARIQDSRPSRLTDALVAPPHLLALPHLQRPAVAGPAGDLITLPLALNQSETSMAASGLQVVVGFNDDRGTASLSGVMYSTDGGNTFVDGGQLFVLPGGDFTEGDPAVAVYEPPSGPPVFYYATIYVEASGLNTLALYRSTTGGASWQGPFEVASASSFSDFPDRESITVDPETGRVLIAWTNFGASITMRVTSSDDAATGTPPTWSPAALVGTRPWDGQATTIVADPTNSNVYMVWESYFSTGSGNRLLSFAKSTNNGNSWLPPADHAPGFYGRLSPYGCDRWLWSVSGSSLALNPVDGGLEVVYAASADGTPAHDFGDIFYRRSTDGGSSWSPPIPLNVFPGTDRAQFQPAVSAASNGRIDVYWFDQSAGSGLSDYTDLLYTFSTDFGATWSSPVPVTPSPYHVESGNNFSAPQEGDYMDAFALGPKGYGAFFQCVDPVPNGSSPDAAVFSNAAPIQVAPLRLRPGTVTLLDTGCASDDGFLVAGEYGYLTVPLENIGRSGLTGISAVLSASSALVQVDPTPRFYPALAAGGSGASATAFKIRLTPSYPCGERVKLRLDISASGVAPTFLEFSIPTGVVASTTTLLSENFDGVGAPALPAGWSSLAVGTAGPNPWSTTTFSPASGPNAAFAADAGGLTFGRLQGPVVTVPASATFLEVSFDTRYDLQAYDARYAPDGASLEYQLDGAGGSRFATSDAIEFDNVYSHNIARSSGDGFGDRSGWSGSSGGYRHVRIRIPGMAGHTFRPRFDLTTADGGSSGGWWVDNVVINAIQMGCGGCQTVPVVLANLDANVVDGGVDLRWHSNASDVIGGWNLYRGPGPESITERVNAEAIAWQTSGEFQFHDASPSAGIVYYRLAGIQLDGTELEFEDRVRVEVGRQPARFTFTLGGANPFHDRTVVSYSLPARSPVRIELYDVAGRRVRTLLDTVSGPGTYAVSLEPRDDRGRALAAGVYLVRITAREGTRTLRVVAR